MIKKPHRILFWIIGVSVVLRVAVAVYMGNHVVELPGTADQITYHTLATRLLGGYGFTFEQAWWPATAAGAPTAHWSFLYTFFLAFIYSIFGPNPLVARLIQALLAGVLQPVLTYLLAQKIFERMTPRASLIALAAAGGNAVYTYFIYYSAALMTEPLFITSVLGGLYLTICFADSFEADPGRKRFPRPLLLALAFGLVTAAAILLRQLYLLFVPFPFLWIWWKSRNRSIGPLLLAGGIIVVSILPFTFYNYARFNRFVLLNTNVGYVLFWANHPIYGTSFIPILESDEYKNLIPVEIKRQRLDEAALDQALLRLGVRFILDDPARYLLLSLSRVPVYFEFWPSRSDGLISNIARVAGFGLFLPFMLAGFLLTWRRLLRQARPVHKVLASRLFLLTLFMGFYTALHVFAWALIRYRLPVDAVLLPFAGLCLVELAVWLAGKTRLKLPGVEQAPPG
jgi:hypothetical protein